MYSYEDCIGKNIREVRLQRSLSQEELARKCGFSNTTLSAYENNRKTPNLFTTAIIARNLNVSIERLFYGDENNSFITADPDDGRRIVNAIYYLWKMGIIYYHQDYTNGIDLQDYYENASPKGTFLYLQKFDSQIKRLILSLNEFERNKETYSDPDAYLDMLLSSVSAEINNEINYQPTIRTVIHPNKLP